LYPPFLVFSDLNVQSVAGSAVSSSFSPFRAVSLRRARPVLRPARPRSIIADESDR
jgi:hypothetical protein